MSINLVQAVNSVMSDSIAEQLSQQFGISAQIVRQLAARITLGIVASLMDRASLVPGARTLFTVVMQPESNAYIVDQFDKLISTTGGLKHLEVSGHTLAASATGRRLDALTDAVSARNQRADSGHIRACVHRVGRAVRHHRHLLLAQWSQPQLPKLLSDQVAKIRTSLTNHVATVIGVGHTDNFAHSVSARLDAVSATLIEHEEAEAAVAATDAKMAERAGARRRAGRRGALDSGTLARARARAQAHQQVGLAAVRGVGRHSGLRLLPRLYAVADHRSERKLGKHTDHGGRAIGARRASARRRVGNGDCPDRTACGTERAGP